MTTPSSLYLVPTHSVKPASTPNNPEPATPKEKEGSSPPVVLYSPPSMTAGLFKTVASSMAVTLMLFLLLPLTRYIAQFAEDYQYNSISVVNPPPPPLPEVQELEEEQVEEAETPEMEAVEPEPISLSELQASLHVGAGTSFAGGADLSQFFFQVEDIGEIIFEIKDLDKKPKLLSANPPQYPPELKRDRVEGEVVLLVMINEEGKVSVLDVERSTHRMFEMSAIRAARSAIYTPPTRNGEKVKVKFYLPFNFRLKDFD